MFSIPQNLLFLLFALIWSSTTNAVAHRGFVFQQTPLRTQTFFGTPRTLPIIPALPPLPPFPTRSTPIAPQPRITNPIGNSNNLKFFYPSSFGTPVVDNNFLPDIQSYIVDGRVLKQYLVEEQQDDVLPPQNFGINPILLNDFDNLYTKYTNTQDFFQIRASNGQTSIVQPITRNHGPVALGSGSLGYIRQPNGGVFLGSGSLGYSSSQERISAINDARRRKNVAASPITFGDSIPSPI